DRLAGILLHVNAEDAHASDAAAGGQRAIELRNLVALRQVGVEVVLARENRALVHGAAGGDGGADGQLDGAFVQNGQRARIAETDRADLRVRSGAERGRA